MKSRHERVHVDPNQDLFFEFRSWPNIDGLKAVDVWMRSEFTGPYELKTTFSLVAVIVQANGGPWMVRRYDSDEVWAETMGPFDSYERAEDAVRSIEVVSWTLE